MKKLFWQAGVLAALLPGIAAASTCEARYRAQDSPAPPDWISLGAVNGPKKDLHCLAKTRNELGNLGPKALGLTKEKICEIGRAHV